MRSTWKRLAAVAFATALVAAACGRDDSSSSSDDGLRRRLRGLHRGASGAFIDPAIDCADYDAQRVSRTARSRSAPFAQPMVPSRSSTRSPRPRGLATSVNSNGGIPAGDGNSYEVEVIKENDSYDPGKTPALAQKLVEQDGVFRNRGTIGTENNLAIRDYLNDNCVPQHRTCNRSPNWGDADQYPWYITGLPSYALEANYWLDYIAETNPEAKIALLYQDDDFGTAYKDGAREGSRAEQQRQRHKHRGGRRAGLQPAFGYYYRGRCHTAFSLGCRHVHRGHQRNALSPDAHLHSRDLGPGDVHLGHVCRQYRNVDRRTRRRGRHPGPGDPGPG